MPVRAYASKIRDIERGMKDHIRAIQREAEQAIYCRLPTVIMDLDKHHRQTKDYVDTFLPALEDRFYALIRAPTITQTKKGGTSETVFLNDAFPLMSRPDLARNPTILFPTAELLDLEQALNAQCRAITETIKAIRRWLELLAAGESLSVPAEEAISTSIQLLDAIEASTSGMSSLFAEYHSKRSKTILKFQKHDSFDCYQLIVLGDRRMFQTIADFVEDLFDMSCTCYEILNQSFDRLLNPRHKSDRLVN